MFRRNKPETIFQPAETPAAKRVIETLISHEFDRDEVVLVGSAALALYGAYLHVGPDDDGTELPNASRPGDVDLLSSASYALTVLNGDTHQSLNPSIKGNPNNLSQRVIRLDTAPLPTDIISKYKGYDDDEKQIIAFDKRFRQRIAQNSFQLEGSGFRIATPENIAAELRRRQANDKKAQRDLAELHKAMQSIRRVE